MPARVHIFDPAFGVSDGHYLTYNGAIVAELARRGVAATVYASRSWKAKLAPDFPVIPLFRFDIFDEGPADRLTWPVENFMAANDAAFADLAGLGSEGFHRDDLALFVTATQNQIDGVRRWLNSLPPERRPTVMLRLAYMAFRMPHLLQRPNKDLQALLLRYAVQRLLAEHPGAIIATDTDEMASDLGSITGAPVTMLPLPLPVTDAPPRQAPAGPLNCVYLGYAADTKGVGLLPDIIRHFQESGTLRFTVQFHSQHDDFPQVEAALDAIPPSLLTQIKGPMSRAEYISSLQAADIVLLPYHLGYYGWASSGIFVEAALLGKVIVAPSGSWMARQAEAYGCGCKTFDALTAGGVAAALEGAVADFPALQQKASAAAAGYAGFHSPEHYVAMLLRHEAANVG